MLYMEMSKHVANFLKYKLDKEPGDWPIRKFYQFSELKIRQGPVLS
jgi:hypothetical protein